MGRKPKLEPYGDEAARLVARIFGESSAAAQALANMEERRERGERPALFRDVANNAFVVIDKEG